MFWFYYLTYEYLLRTRLLASVASEVTTVTPESVSVDAEPSRSIVAGQLYGVLFSTAVSRCGSDFIHPVQLSALQLALTIGPVMGAGAFIPIGGIDSITAMLTETILEAGGAIIYDAPEVAQISLEISSTPNNNNSIRAAGVVLENNYKSLGNYFSARKTVISCLGVLYTYLNLIVTEPNRAGENTPEVTTNTGTDHQSGSETIEKLKDIRQALSTVSESIPYVLCIFWIKPVSFQANELKPYLECEYTDIPNINWNDSEPTTIEDAQVCSKGAFRIWSPVEHNANRLEDDSNLIIIVETVAPVELVTACRQKSACGLRDKYAFNSYTEIQGTEAKTLRSDCMLALQRVFKQITPADINYCSVSLSPTGGHSLLCNPAKYAADIKSRSLVIQVYSSIIFLVPLP